MSRSLTAWLEYQESLHPREIELGLDRSRLVAERLNLRPPAGRVFTVAGTNGKGSTAHYLNSLMTGRGWRAGLYTSPHLRLYNERIRVAGQAVSDEALVAAFEAVDNARAEVPLTYFEFGTLAALWLFTEENLDAWVLEVGLGGRLDAVNLIDADFSLITTVDFDHRDWLGDTIEAIAAEKAGILRPHRPAFYGDQPLPAAVRNRADAIAADLRVAGQDFGHVRSDDHWGWWTDGFDQANLPMPSPGDDVQLANLSLALAAAGACDRDLLASGNISSLVSRFEVSGRFQRCSREGQEWIFDVAHNPQAAGVLAQRVRELPPVAVTTLVLGLHASKDLNGFLAPFDGLIQRWICCRAGQMAGWDPGGLATRLEVMGKLEVFYEESPAAAVALAAGGTPRSERVIVCGSFEVVGPAMAALGLTVN
ncbi:MAG: bifunctional folylpolyglutamate synthase/dihydrofolate synthase [Gammaproteobacteria bacterium]